MIRTATVGSAPTRMLASPRSRPGATLAIACCRATTPVAAWCWNASPRGVSASPLGPRVNRRTLRNCSSSRRVFDTAGWVTASWSAARPTWPRRATSMKHWRWRIFMRASIMGASRPKRVGAITAWLSPSAKFSFPRATRIGHYARRSTGNAAGEAQLMAFDRLGDIVVHHADSGPTEAPPLVLVNSLGTDLRVWDTLLPRLGGRFRCLRYDKRGHGLSDTAPGPYAMEELAADLARLLDARGARKAVVCGLSIGGMIAQALAAARPDLVRGLVLMDTAHKIGTPEMWDERMAAIRTGGIGGIADAILLRWFSPAFHQERPAELSGWRNMLTRTPVEGYLGCCAAIRDADLTAAARAVSVPTLCLVGEHDGSTPPDLVAQLAGLVRRS